MAGMSDYLRNKIQDWLHRGLSYTPPATIYIGLCSTAPTAAAAGTPISGTGYGRIALTQDVTNMSSTNGDTLVTNPSTGTTGVVSNNVIVDFGSAGGSWGTASHWESFDASTGGNRLQYGTIVDGAGAAAPRSIASGDPVSFPISSLRFGWA